MARVSRPSPRLTVCERHATCASECRIAPEHPGREGTRRAPRARSHGGVRRVRPGRVPCRARPRPAFGGLLRDVLPDHLARAGESRGRGRGSPLESLPGVRGTIPRRPAGRALLPGERRVLLPSPRARGAGEHPRQPGHRRRRRLGARARARAPDLGRALRRDRLSDGWPHDLAPGGVQPDPPRHVRLDPRRAVGDRAPRPAAGRAARALARHRPHGAGVPRLPAGRVLHRPGRRAPRALGARHAGIAAAAGARRWRHHRASAPGVPRRRAGVAGGRDGRRVGADAAAPGVADRAGAEPVPGDRLAARRLSRPGAPGAAARSRSTCSSPPATSGSASAPGRSSSIFTLACHSRPRCASPIVSAGSRASRSRC